MMERVFESIIAVAAIAAAAAMAVFAAGFALYALMLTWFPPSGAAAIVAASAAVFAAGVGMVVRARAEKRKLMEEVERARAAEAAAAPRAAFSGDVTGWLDEHPFAALAVSALGGFLATRNPALAGEIIAALRGVRPREE